MEDCWRLKPKADGQAHQCTWHRPWLIQALWETVTQRLFYRPQMIQLALCASLPQIQGLSKKAKWEFGGQSKMSNILKGKPKNDSKRWMVLLFTHPDAIPKYVVGDNVCGEGESTHPGLPYLNNNYDILLCVSVASLSIELGIGHIHLPSAWWNSLV